MSKGGYTNRSLPIRQKTSKKHVLQVELDGDVPRKIIDDADISVTYLCYCRDYPVLDTASKWRVVAIDETTANQAILKVLGSGEYAYPIDGGSGNQVTLNTYYDSGQFLYGEI